MKPHSKFGPNFRNQWFILPVRQVHVIMYYRASSSSILDSIRPLDDDIPTENLANE